MVRTVCCLFFICIYVKIFDLFFQLTEEDEIDLPSNSESTAPSSNNNAMQMERAESFSNTPAAPLTDPNKQQQQKQQQQQQTRNEVKPPESEVSRYCFFLISYLKI